MNNTGKRPDAIVIGAGLAGAAACERLAARGWQLTLLERHAQSAQEASGNLAGIFMPVLSKDDNRTSQLVRAAYLFAQHLWQNLGGVGRAFPGETCGVLQLARDTAHADVQHEIAQQRQFPAEFAEWLDSATVNRLLGTAENTGGWWFPQGGWAHPAGVCQAMLAACGKQLTTLFSQDIRHLVRTAHGWQVCDGAGIVIAQAPVVILANGIHATGFSQTARLPLAAVRGQVTHVPAASLPVLPFVLCRDAYLARPFQGIYSTGASYDAHADPLLRQDSQTDNLARLGRLLPHLPLSLETLPLAGRVGFRCRI
jgi:tRNA 5-methylaminomethyl-2-thiouridine biosynthesis bifunctional protein